MGPPVVLRYFHAQGRVQALRHALADAGVEHEDVRVTLEAWPQHKEDPLYAGEYGALPTLTWGEVTIAETLPIASFIGKKLGHYARLDDAGIARLEAVTSCAYVDVLLNLGQLLWAEAAFPGVDLKLALPRPVGRVVDKLARLGKQLPAEGWLGGDRPAVADFYAGEAMELARHVLGPAREPILRERAPRLFAHSEAIRARPAIARIWERRPPNFTASPTEPAAVERMRGLDFSSIGL